MDIKEEEEDSEWVNERTLMETNLSSEGWKPWTTKLNEDLPKTKAKERQHRLDLIEKWRSSAPAFTPTVPFVAPI